MMQHWAEGSALAAKLQLDKNHYCTLVAAQDHMKFISKLTLQDLKCADHEEAAKLMASWYRNLAALWTEWQVRCTSLLLRSVVSTHAKHITLWLSLPGS